MPRSPLDDLRDRVAIVVRELSDQRHHVSVIVEIINERLKDEISLRSPELINSALRQMVGQVSLRRSKPLMDSSTGDLLAYYGLQETATLPGPVENPSDRIKVKFGQMTRKDAIAYISARTKPKLSTSDNARKLQSIVQDLDKYLIGDVTIDEAWRKMQAERESKKK